MIDAPRPRILLVTRNLPPLVGGMERLNWHMADELSRHADVRVIGPAGSAALAPRGVTVEEAPLRPLWKFLLRARALARRAARKWKPDVVLAGSGLTAPIARSAARTCGAKVAAYVHGLDLAVKHPVYRALWLPALRRMDRVIANSRATAGLAREAGIEPARIGIVHPGVELPPQGPDVEAVARFRAEHDLGSRPLLLSVGRLSARKGLREFVAEVLPHIVSDCPDVMLLIVGDAPKQALHAQAQTPESILKAAQDAGTAGCVRFLGNLSDEALQTAYACADVHVFPVRELPGDIEGFGMVAVESASYGVPTVAYAVGGVTDAVEEGVSGRLVAAGNAAAFAAAVIAMLRQPLRKEQVRAFAARFEWRSFGERLRTELEAQA
ncbi:MAG TPA: glycosyltransferase family 4 protein [Burkholderiales bacterium]|jgi:phosphatidylinositol alpha-1,6-mannosyltransferase|nr:glycosyltransferase family 4 protein [Burkholderiales bacterium]